jgi:hypothetical protein
VRDVRAHGGDGADHHQQAVSILGAVHELLLGDELLAAEGVERGVDVLRRPRRWSLTHHAALRRAEHANSMLPMPQR